MQIKRMEKDPKSNESYRKYYAKIKVALLGAIGIGSCLLSFVYLRSFFETSSPLSLTLSVVAGLVLFVAIILQVLFVRHIGTLITIAFLESVTPLLLFIKEIKAIPSSLLLLLGSGAFFILLSFGFSRGRSVAENSLHIKFFHIIRPVLPKALTGFIIFVSILTYMSYFKWSSFNEVIARQLSDKLVESVEPALRIWIPGTSFNGTVSEFLRNMSEYQLKKIGTNPLEIESSFAQMSGENRERIISSVAKELEKKIEIAINKDIEAGDTVKEVFFQTMKKYTEEIRAKNNLEPYIGISVVLFIFAILKSFSFIAKWIIELVALVSYKILIALNFARIASVDIRKEEIIL